jgi:hypothetical protein
LHEKARSGAPPKIDGRIETQLTLLACSEPPDGRSKWTVRLLRIPKNHFLIETIK